MLKNMKITQKLPLVMIVFALISALTTGAVAYLQAANAIKGQAESNLYALLESRESSLDQYFSNIELDLHYYANSDLIKNAFDDFSSSWEQLPGSQYDYLKLNYQTNNPYLFDQRSYLLAAKDGSNYSSSHEKYHSAFTAFISAGAFYDLFLIDPSGNIIYTVKKESDFATNLVNGSWSKTGLADAFDQARLNPEVNKLNFVDFSFYGPSEDGLASFVSTSVYDDKANLLGVLVLQLSIEKLDEVMQVTAGMGSTGETYLVGPDLTMRSDSRFYSKSSILKTTVDTLPVKRALDGEENVMVAKDYRGVNVYSAFKSIDVFGKSWAMLAEIDESEVLAPVKNLNQFLVAAGSIIALLIAFFGYLFSSDLANPIRSMTNTMNRLSKNDLSTNISVDERSDEVGLMADALIEFKKSAIERQELKEHLNHMAKHDSLTGLPNREFVLPLLKLKTDTDNIENIGLTVMFADLDDFKKVNDQHGHFLGDELLKQVSARLKDSVREGDVVARIGGDEFLIVLADKPSPEDCNSVADHIFDVMKDSFSIGLQTVNVGVSLGSATFPHDSKTTNELLTRADQAMYAAKTKGKNRYVAYDETLTEKSGKRGKFSLTRI